MNNKKKGKVRIGRIYSYEYDPGHIVRVDYISEPDDDGDQIIQFTILQEGKEMDGDDINTLEFFEMYFNLVPVLRAKLYE